MIFLLMEHHVNLQMATNEEGFLNTKEQDLPCHDHMQVGRGSREEIRLRPVTQTGIATYNPEQSCTKHKESFAQRFRSDFKIK